MHKKSKKFKIILWVALTILIIVAASVFVWLKFKPGNTSAQQFPMTVMEGGNYLGTALAKDPNNSSFVSSVFITEGNVCYNQSQNGGESWDISSWSCSWNLTQGSQADIAITGSSRQVVAINNNGNLQVVYMQGSSYDSATGPFTIFSGPVSNPSISSYGSTVVIVWDSNNKLMKAVSTDDGSSFPSENISVLAEASGNTNPDITSSSTGKWAIVYNDSNELKAFMSDDGQAWTARTNPIVSLDVSDGYAAVTAPDTANGDFYTAYEDTAEGGSVVKLVRWNSTDIIGDIKQISQYNGASDGDSHHPTITFDNENVWVAWDQLKNQ